MSSVNIETPGGVNIAGDVVGHDKITNIYQYGEKKERPAPRMAPPAPRVFIGRDEVLRELIATLKLDEDGAGPIALTALKGMGGIGKTTLAAALANHPEVETALPEGTLWAGLGPGPEVMSLLAEWGSQLGEDFAPFDSPETRSRRLSTLLHDKKALLIVDDVWQAEAARYFLVGGPRCRMLITTRDNEIARKLAGHEAIRVETLTKVASLNLLRELVPQAVTADEIAANELATVLDGLPLAITLAGQMLAAEWEVGLGVAGALSELKDREARLKLAGAEKRTGLATTELSLRAILAMSYDRLPDEATKRAFRLLGVFGGKPLTFSIEAAAAVWQMELRPAQKTMVALVGRALVEPVDGGRYTLHTTLADFAESLLEEHGEAALARETHANYYLKYAQKNAEKNWQRVEMDMGQIRRGFEWVSSVSTDRPTNNRIVFDYLWAMDQFFNWRSLLDDKMNWTEAALTLARLTGDRQNEGTLINNIGFIYRCKGLWDEALGCYEQSQAIQKEIGDHAGLALTFNYIGFVYRMKNMWDEALKYYKHSQVIQEEIGERAGLADTLENIGEIYKSIDSWDEALKYYECSQKIYEEIGDGAGIAETLNDMGDIYYYKGAWDEALGYYERGKKISEEIGHRAWLAYSLTQIGNLYRDKRLFDKALGYYEQDLAIREEIGQRSAQAAALRRIGSIYDDNGLWDEALNYYERSRAIREEIGDRLGLARMLQRIGKVYEKQTRFTDAEKFLTQAVAILEALGSPELDNARKQLEKIRELQQTASQK